MRIRKISLFKCDKPFQFEFKSTHAQRINSETIIIQLDFDNGIVGYGESTPRPYVTGEDCSTVVDTIKRIYSPRLLSAEIADIKDVKNTLFALESEHNVENASIFNSALGAIDIALLDALGKYQNISSSYFLGQESLMSVPYSISVPFLPMKKVQEIYDLMKKFGFHHVKVLLSSSESEDLERIAFLRTLLGEKADIRVEINGKWSFEQAVSNLDKLQKFNISAIEQPLPKNDIEGLKKLKKKIGVPIIADESMCSLSDAKNLIDMDACDILNIKISKCGGLLKSREIALYAASRNIPCQLGAHVGETEILTAAGLCFTRSIPDLLFFEGFSSLLFQDNWVAGGLKINKKPVSPKTAFGLGVDSEGKNLIHQYCRLMAELECD